MRAADASVPAEDFERFFATGQDPYGFRTSWYEQRKRALTLATLGRERYEHVLEIGCAEGVLTELLAERADRVTAVDASRTAVERAARSLAAVPAVEVRVATVPAEIPAGTFDLVVVAEVGYFLGRADLDALARAVSAAVVPGGELVAVHWREPSEDYPSDGAAVHARFDAEPGWRRTVTHAEKPFLLDAWRRR